MSIADKLNELQATKVAIKNAIEEKGQDLTNVRFTEFAEKITAISGGRKFTTGTVTFAITETQNTVTHNLGVVPSCVILYPKNLSFMPENNSSEAKGTAWEFIYIKYDKGNIDIGLTYQGHINTGALTWQPNVTASLKPYATETSFITSAANLNYKFGAGIEFEWIAIE